MPGQILVVDPDTRNRIVLRSRVALSCHDVIQADCGIAGLKAVAEHGPDLVLLGPGFSADAACGLTAKIRGANPVGAPPVLVLTHDPRREVLHRALCAGAEDVIGDSMQSDYLLALIRNLMRQRGALDELVSRSMTERLLGLAEHATGFLRPGHVALIARNSSVARSWNAAMAMRCSHRLSWMVHDDALRSGLTEANTDLFVVEDTPERPEETLRLIAELRSRAEGRHARLILVSDDRGRPSLSQVQRLAMALDVGAHDTMRGGFDPDELRIRADVQINRKHREDRLRNRVRDGLREALRDPLTGLYNRRYALPHVARMAERCHGKGQCLSAMMIDVDRFKSVNDTFGHHAGDAVLSEIATRLRDNTREQDLVARIGGEEFLIALPDTDLDHAQNIAGRLCSQVSQRGIHAVADRAPLFATISIGVAEWNPYRAGSDAGVICGDSLTQDLISRADTALYAAKARGRNRVTVSDVAA